MRALVAGLALVAAALATPAPARAQTLTLLNPQEAVSVTTREFVNVLGRTEPGNRVTVAGTAVPVYATGVFVRDRVPLAAGENRIVIEARDGAGSARQLVLALRREPAPPPPAPVTDRLFIDAASTQPRELRMVDERETVDVGFHGTPGMLAEARWAGHAEAAWFPLVERSPGRYAARLLLRDDGDRFEQPVLFRLAPAPGSALAGQPAVSASAPGLVGLWRSEGVRLWRTTGTTDVPTTPLTHGLHQVRLGGPFVTELPRGVLLRATGRVGDQLRIALAPDLIAWAPLRSMAAAEPAAALPDSAAASFTHFTIRGGPGGDVVDIPWPSTLPYAARSATTPDGQPLIELDLFGSHHATTWISHRASAALVREATVEQAGPERVRIRVHLLHPRLWGWSIEPRGEALRLTVHAPPPLESPATASPLHGLRIALEAGHGSRANLGAVGATGVPEKDINRWTTDALRAELEAAGAQVVDIRVGDENPNLRERAERVEASGAQLFVSMHANAADTTHGYLRAAGTSMLYKHPHSRPLAQAIHQRLLAETGLPDFGLISNFNYTPTRLVSRMPAVLVEQAFVSNPEEEALLLDPAFRARLAKAVRLGIEDFLRLR